MSRSPALHLSDAPVPIALSSSASASGRRPATLLLAGLYFAGLSILASATSDGFLEADSCTHYLYARAAVTHPGYFADVWGRPVCTGLYALPAYLGGRAACQAVSLALALTCAAVAYGIAKGQGYRLPELAFIFTLAQPIVFLHSFSVLTELPFATLLGLAFLAYQRRHWRSMALLASLLPLTRPEGFGFVALAALALVLHRRALWLLALPIPLVLWSYAGYALADKPVHYTWPLWLIRNWPYAAQSLYPSGPLVHFLVLLPAILSPFVLPAIGLGAWRNVRDRPADAHLRRCQWLVVVFPLTVLIVHSVLYWKGKMASSGEPRYMTVAAPFWALLGARGWAWMFGRFNFRRPVVWACIAAVLPALVNNHYHVLPLDMNDDWQDAERLARSPQFQSLRARYPNLLVAHQGFFYYMDVDRADPSVIDWSRETVSHPRPGTILVWDKQYGTQNADDRRRVPLGPDPADEAHPEPRWKGVESYGWVPQPQLDEILVRPSVYRGQTIRKQRDEEGHWPWAVFLSPVDKDGQVTGR